MKDKANQKLEPRSPRQQRAKQKVELILESAMRLLDKGGFALLTTNAVAETAGVSIGTLYQYFPNKEAILDALAEREIAEMSARVLAIIADATPVAPKERIGRIVHAVAASYGDRPKVHRLVMEHSLARGSHRMAPMIGQIAALLADPARAAATDPRLPVSKVDAFVLTHAFAGVMRGMIAAAAEDRAPDKQPPGKEAVAEALTRLITGFAADRD